MDIKRLGELVAELREARDMAQFADLQSKAVRSKLFELLEIMEPDDLQNDIVLLKTALALRGVLISEAKASWLPEPIEYVASDLPLYTLLDAISIYNKGRPRLKPIERDAIHEAIRCLAEYGKGPVALGAMCVLQKMK